MYSKIFWFAFPCTSSKGWNHNCALSEETIFSVSTLFSSYIIIFLDPRISLSPSLGQRSLLDLFPPLQYFLSSTKEHISRWNDLQRFKIMFIFVVIHESSDLAFQFLRRIIVCQFYNVLNGLVISLTLVLCDRRIRRFPNMLDSSAPKIFF